MHAIIDVWPINFHFTLIRTQLDDINAVAERTEKHLSEIWQNCLINIEEVDGIACVISSRKTS